MEDGQQLNTLKAHVYDILIQIEYLQQEIQDLQNQLLPLNKQIIELTNVKPSEKLSD